MFIAIKRNLDIKSTPLDFQCAAEILGITLKFNDGTKIILSSFYRVKNLGSANHNEFEMFFKKARSRRGVRGMIVTGDINLPDVDWDRYSSPNIIEQSFLDSFSNFELEQFVKTPTHNKGNILDLLLTDKTQLISNVKVSDFNKPCKSDHFNLTFQLNSKVKRLKIPKREVFNYKRADWDSLNKDIKNVDWQAELQGDIEQSWLSFETRIFDLLDKHIPKIKIGGKLQPTWFDAETHQQCRKKERCHQLYKDAKNKQPEDTLLTLNRYLKFSNERKKFKNLVTQKHGDSFEDEDDSNLITKKFWSYAKATANTTRIPEVVQLDGSYKSKPLEQANLFNNFFYNQFSDASSYDIPVDLNNNDFEINLNPSRVEEILKKLSPSKAMGPDKIHGHVLKNCSNTLCVPLSIMFKISYSTSIIPTQWKLALVVPVHKKGSKSDVENYRPISLTCLIMKVFERLINNELMFKCSQMIDPRQHGFLRNKSCSTQLVNFCDSLHISLNSSIRSDVIYFDFAKAFDSVNHDLLLSKLKSLYSVDGLLLNFIKNYLKGRNQSVVIGGHISEQLPVLSGVPQGSIIGPTLFVLFMNDIVSVISHDTNILMYADDTKIWRQILSESDHETLQNDIDNLIDWSVRNKMKFHPSKTKVLMVSKFKPPLIDILPCIQYYYKMGTNLLDYVSAQKDLGILMNNTLNFTEHANSLYNTANQKLGILKRTCHFVKDENKRRVLYLTLVRSIFEHCPIVWRPSNNTVINKLESIQKRAFKWIRNNEYISYSGNDLLYYTHCKQLNILPIKFRFDFHDLKFFHSLVYKYSCVDLPAYIQNHSGISRLRSCHLDALCFVSCIIPRGNFTSTSRRGFYHSYFYRSHLMWNILPKILRQNPRPGLFKRELLKFIWNQLCDLNDSYDSDTLENSVNDSDD